MRRWRRREEKGASKAPQLTVGGAGTPPQSPELPPPHCTPALGPPESWAPGAICFPSRISRFAKAEGEQVFRTTQQRRCGPTIYLTRGQGSSHHVPPPLPLGHLMPGKGKQVSPSLCHGQLDRWDPDSPHPHFQVHCPL
uniref:Uncharacterized protein n=1 Tax=Rousettus aegyptiacus TaxID=9407 RepID=A0A7J8H0K9_ROUAE|nr:hypothetical protein HJG63_011160 [Rousettus aegyptiacus]